MTRTLVFLLGAVVAALVCLADFGAARAASCSASVSDLDFGAVDTLSGQSSQTAGNISIACESVADGASGVSVCVHLGAGSPQSSGGDRAMGAAGGATLIYQLFADAAHQVPWGSVETPRLGQPQRFFLPARSNAASGTANLYARLPGNQSDSPAGQFTASFSGLDAFLTYGEGDAIDCQAASGPSEPLSFRVFAAVQENCRVETQDVSFGPQVLLSGTADAVGGIDVSCTPGTDFTITINGGLGNSTDPSRRIMRSGQSTVCYGLYLDAARSRPWGAAQGLLEQGTGTGRSTSIPVYGRVPRQNVPAGAYSDTVGVTVTYGFPPS